MTNEEDVATDEMIRWLIGRGLDPKKAGALGWAPLRRKGETWVSIPYRRGGQVINTKYRKLGEKVFAQTRDGEQDLYNVDALINPDLLIDPLIITEGECDALACMMAGYPKTVSVPGGWSEGIDAPSGGRKEEPFTKNLRALSEQAKVIVAGDNDDVGRSLIRYVKNLLPDNDVYYAEWPDGCKDANDVVVEHGVERLAEALNEAKHVNPPGGRIYALSDAPPAPKVSLYRTGIKVVDRLMAFCTREISVLTGTPGSGKTTFVLWALHHVVRTNDIRVGLGVFETSDRQLSHQLVMMRTGKDFETLPPAEKKLELQKLDRNWRVYRRHEKEDVEADMNWVRSMVHDLAVVHGCKIIVIDPWNELEHVPRDNESLTTYYNVALSHIRRWAEQYDVHICIVAHPRKIGKNDIPYGYEIADSAAFANKPAFGWTIHPHETAFDVLLITWKVRDTQFTNCTKGKTKLEFDPDAMVYREKLT